MMIICGCQWCQLSYCGEEVVSVSPQLAENCRNKNEHNTGGRQWEAEKAKYGPISCEITRSQIVFIELGQLGWQEGKP